MKEIIKLLLVEDERILARIIVESFEKEMMEVRYASDGSVGLKLYESFNPDICLIDIIMPELDGITLVRKIRCRDSQTPLIFLSSKSETLDVLEGFRAGADDYLKKPFCMEELKARTYALLKRANRVVNPNLTDNKIKIGRYVFENAKQELRYRGEIKKLSYRESEILNILTNTRNIIASKREILMDIWGNDSIYNTRSLDVYMAKIRKYLIRDKNVQIISIRGKGYRLSVQAI